MVCRLTPGVLIQAAIFAGSSPNWPSVPNMTGPATKTATARAVLRSSNARAKAMVASRKRTSMTPNQRTQWNSQEASRPCAAAPAALNTAHDSWMASHTVRTTPSMTRAFAATTRSRRGSTTKVVRTPRWVHSEVTGRMTMTAVSIEVTPSRRNWRSVPVAILARSG